jgi:hypothetical protein
MRTDQAKKLGARQGIGLVIIAAAGQCYPLPLEQLSNETLAVLDSHERVIVTERLTALARHTNKRGRTARRDR